MGWGGSADVCSRRKNTYSGPVWSGSPGVEDDVSQSESKPQSGGVMLLHRLEKQRLDAVILLAGKRFCGLARFRHGKNN